MEARTYLAVLVTVVLWASAFAGIRAGLESYSPESLALLRYLTASVVLLAYALLTRMPRPTRRDIPGIAILGFVGFTFYNVALNAGEEEIQAGTASMMIASAPIFVALLAITFFRERLAILAWLGILLSFIGVAVISIRPGSGLQVSLNSLLVLAAAIASAVYIVGQKPFLRRYHAIQFTSYAMWAGTFVLLLFLPGLLKDIQSAAAGATLAVIYIGIFPGAIGYASWSYVLSRMPASRAGSFLYLIPAMAIIVAWIWLGEVPGLAAVVGGGMILLGVLLVNTRRRAR